MLVITSIEIIMLGSQWVGVWFCCRFPDREVGQFPMAYIVRKKGSNLSEREVMEFVAKQVSMIRSSDPK